ncbi:WbqC family protein [Enterococcus diestrammenae]|uniref:Uncharacterized protein n=1 Tax=Enterococcus diestrammenae TaxID=1155073 RepID=A0ABV0F1S0_9ENTE|nr:WbqC family protein [Enterococcus diestrammenae]KAF1298810.1 hypothetical protein BAU18_06080 [Enterococcus diestrammenae]
MKYSELANILVIHQPNFFPTIKVLNKLLSGNKLIFLDDVQYVRNDIQNRIKFRNLKNPESLFWFSAGVKKGSSRKKINDVAFFSFEEMAYKLEKTIFDTYSSSIHYPFLEKYLQVVLSKNQSILSDFNIFSLTKLLEILNIDLKYDLSSNLSLDHSITGESRLIEITKSVGYSTYLSGLGGKNYINPENFNNENITLLWHPWISPHNDEKSLTWDKVSFIDFIARYGERELKCYITKKRIVSKID